MTAAIWTPAPAARQQTALAAFMRDACRHHGLAVSDYEQLHRWSINQPEAFWSEVWDFCGVIGERGERVLIDGDQMPGAQFFPDARLNFAENLLRRCDDSDALVFWAEDRLRGRLSWRQLHAEVARLAAALQAAGVGEGDRVAALLPNCPEAIVAMLATTSLGAVWASCSPDFGEQGVLDRFGQIKPALLIGCDGYFYAGKSFSCLEKLGRIAAQMPGLPAVIVVPYANREKIRARPSLASVPGGVWLDEFVAGHDDSPLKFPRLSFAHPLYILFSSGTTGAPKCIVHSVGGTLLQHLKEHRLQTDLRAGDRFFYFTTCTWMMWNWLVSGLATEATLLLFDGSPFHPSPEVLFDFAVQERMTHFGTSAKYIDTLKKRGQAPMNTHDLGRLRVLLSTGSPLVAESFDYVYGSIKRDLCLASISGGTDIVATFVGGNPISPVYRGEIQCASLGMAVEVWNDAGQPVNGEKGELVCTQAFPSMPLGFWGDDDGHRYRETYFATYPGVWAQGDFAERTGHGGFIIYGRSDATLNPGGIRIGTAEIYRQVEQIDEVLESVVIGQSWRGDVRVVLFVVLREGFKLDDALEARIRQQIRAGASPRHLPARILQVGDIPRTKSGKLAELAVRDMVEGRPVKNQSALANPQALELFRELPALRD